MINFGSLVDEGLEGNVILNVMFEMIDSDYFVLELEY